MRIKDSHMKKLQKETPKSKKHKILKATKIVLYAVMWLIAWSAIAFGMAVVLIMSVVFSIAPDGVMTPREANNSVLAVILIIGALFLGTVWLMRKAKSLSYRTSRYVLLVCTVTGLLVGIPMSLLGVWQPDVDSSNSAATIDEKKPELKRYQYMLCSDGSYRMYTDEQMKTPGVGFTDESQDSCEENEHGKMLQLTNSLEEAKANSKKQSTYTPIPTETCTEIDIPFKTIREPVDWLYVGEEKEAYTGGIDGSRKVYVPTSEFSPLFEHEPNRVLSALSRGFGEGIGKTLLLCGIERGPVTAQSAFGEFAEVKNLPHFLLDFCPQGGAFGRIGVAGIFQGHQHVVNAGAQGVAG